MKEKKTEVVTFRTDKAVKEKLDEIATQKEWSVSQVVEKICREYFDKYYEKEIKNNGN